MNWLKNVLGGSEAKVENTEHTMDDKIAADLNINTLFKSVVAAEDAANALNKTANITSLVDEHRARHAASLSDSNLASALTELGLIDAEKSVMLGWRDEYPKMLEFVKKNRKKAEEKLIKYVPFHNMKKKASLGLVAYPSVWSVISENGIDTIVKMVADPYEATRDAKDVSFSLLSSIGVVHNGDNVEITSSDEELPFEKAEVVGIDAMASNGKFLLVKVAIDENLKTKVERVISNLAEMFQLKDLANKYISINRGALGQDNHGTVTVAGDDYEVSVRIRNYTAVIAYKNTTSEGYHTESYRFAVPDCDIHATKSGEVHATFSEKVEAMEARAIQVGDVLKIADKIAPVASIDFSAIKLTDEEKTLIKSVASGKKISDIAKELNCNVGKLFLSLESEIKPKFNAVAGRKLSHTEFIKAASPVVEIEMEVKDNADFMGTPQKLDDLHQQVPGVYRDIAQDFCKNTKDFGEFQSVNKSYPSTEDTDTQVPVKTSSQTTEQEAHEVAAPNEIAKFEHEFDMNKMKEFVKELTGDMKEMYDAMIAEGGEWTMAAVKLGWPTKKLSKTLSDLRNFFKDHGIVANLKTAADVKIDAPTPEESAEGKKDIHDSSGAKVAEVPVMKDAALTTEKDIEGRTVIVDELEKKPEGEEKSAAKVVHFNEANVAEYNDSKIETDHATVKSESPEGVTGETEDGKQVQIKEKDVVAIEDVAGMSLQIVEPFTGKVRTFTITASTEEELEVSEQYSDNKLKVPVTEDEDELKAFITRAIITKVAEVTQYVNADPSNPAVKKPEELKVQPQADAPIKVVDKDGKTYNKQVVQTASLSFAARIQNMSKDEFNKKYPPVEGKPYAQFINFFTDIGYKTAEELDTPEKIKAAFDGYETWYANTALKDFDETMVKPAQDAADKANKDLRDELDKHQPK